jgi:hypothetical protein
MAKDHRTQIRRTILNLYAASGNLFPPTLQAIMLHSKVFFATHYDESCAMNLFAPGLPYCSAV